MLFLNGSVYFPDDRIRFFLARAGRRNKHMRICKRHLKLFRLYNKTKHYYGAGAYFSERKGRIIKYSYNRSSFRKDCNRRFRRRMNRFKYEKVADGASYRKHEEYWWSIL